MLYFNANPVIKCPANMQNECLPVAGRLAIGGAVTIWTRTFVNNSLQAATQLVYLCVCWGEEAKCLLIIFFNENTAFLYSNLCARKINNHSLYLKYMFSRIV